MSWSYSGDPADSDLDAVRFHLQDTDSTDQLMSDEEIEFVLAQWSEVKGSAVYAASVCAEKLAAKFAREVAVSADGVSVQVEALQQKYETLATSLRDEHKEYFGTAGSPTAGGTIFDERFDTSIKPLAFSRGMHDINRAGQQDRGGNESNLEYTIPEDAL